MTVIRHPQCLIATQHFFCNTSHKQCLYQYSRSHTPLKIKLLDCLFVIKPTRCTNFTNFLSRNSTCFGQFVCPSSGIYSLYTQQWYMSYRSVDSFWAGPGWNCSSIQVCIISPSMPRSSNQHFCMFFDQNSGHISCCSRTCYILHPPLSLGFDHPSNISWAVWIVGHLLCNVLQTAINFCLRSQYLHHGPVLQCCLNFPIMCETQVSYPCIALR